MKHLRDDKYIEPENDLDEPLKSYVYKQNVSSWTRRDYFEYSFSLFIGSSVDELYKRMNQIWIMYRDGYCSLGTLEQCLKDNSIKFFYLYKERFIYESFKELKENHELLHVDEICAR